MSLPDGVTTCLVTYGPITDTFGNLADSITVEVVADRTIIHAASGRTMFDVPVSATADAGGIVQVALPHTNQSGFRDKQQNALTGWYYTVTVTARFANGGPKTDRKVFQPVTGQTVVDADLLPSDGMVTPGVTAPTAPVTSVNGQTGAVDLTTTFASLDEDGNLVIDGQPVGGSGGGLDATSLLCPPMLFQRRMIFGGSSIGSDTSHVMYQLVGKGSGQTPMPFGMYGGSIYDIENKIGSSGWDTADAIGWTGNYTINSTGSLRCRSIDAATNDSLPGDPTAARNAFKNLYRTILSLSRCGGGYNSDNGAITYTGTWSAESMQYGGPTEVAANSGFFINGSGKHSTTPGDTISFVVPADRPHLYLYLTGIATEHATTGATYSISGAGLAAPITGTTEAAFNKSVNRHAMSGPVVVKLKGLTPGQTVTVTHTGGAGTTLGCQGVGFGRKVGEAVETFFVFKTWPSTDAQYAADVVKRSALDEVVAEFVDSPRSITNPTGDQTIILVDPAAAGLSPYGSGSDFADTLHPTRNGNRKVLAALLPALLTGVTDPDYAPGLAALDVWMR